MNVAPALVVYISDSLSAEPLAQGAVGVIRDGAYQDSLRPMLYSSAGTLVARSGAAERSGSYLVTVERPGYRPWSRAPVTVTRDACHVRRSRSRRECSLHRGDAGDGKTSRVRRRLQRMYRHVTGRASAALQRTPRVSHA